MYSEFTNYEDNGNVFLCVFMCEMPVLLSELPFSDPSSEAEVAPSAYSAWLKYPGYSRWQ